MLVAWYCGGVDAVVVVARWYVLLELTCYDTCVVLLLCHVVWSLAFARVLCCGCYNPMLQRCLLALRCLAFARDVGVCLFFHVLIDKCMSSRRGGDAWNTRMSASHLTRVSHGMMQCLRGVCCCVCVLRVAYHMLTTVHACWGPYRGDEYVGAERVG